MQRMTMRSSRYVATQLYAHILDPYIDPRGLQHLLLCYCTSTAAETGISFTYWPQGRKAISGQVWRVSPL